MRLIKYCNQPKHSLNDVFAVPALWEPVWNLGLDEPSFTKDFSLPAVDISEDENHVFVKADLPGFEKNNIKVSLEEDNLVIEAERKSEVDNKDKTYHRVERAYGLYRRSIHVGPNVDESQVQAKYTNGVLDVTIPKSKPKDVKAIEIKD